nr:glycosyltransferase family 1 protein [Romeria gracilis]
MKVIFEATPVLPKPSGVGLYVLHLLQALYRLQSQEDLDLGIVYQPSLRNWLRGNLSVPESLAHYPEIYTLPLPVRLLNGLARVPANPILPYLEATFWDATGGAPDIYHGTNYAVYPCRKSLRVMNIYDLSFIRYREHATAVVKSYAHRVQQSLEWADLVITISESSKQDIINFLKVPPESIWVTPLASRYAQASLPLAPNHVRAAVQYDFSIPYILFVSTLEPRKNVVRLIDAFNQLKAKGDIEHHLVLIGQKGWHYGPIFDAIDQSPWRHCIHHQDYLPDQLVAYFYTQADVFAYPSLYEGFGLPVLEAMTLGCPVVTSNTSSLPEVAGDAALLTSPKDAEELADCLERVICDRALRQTLIDRGKARAATYSWQRTAEATLAAYRSLL